MVTEKKKVSTDLLIDPTLQSILLNPTKIMPGFTSEPVVKFEVVRNW
ncbi:MAG: hypothetical protein ACYCR7_04325 [Thermoplasmataceae archaeon]